MKTIDVYRQYFSAACTYNGVERRAALVWLTAESDCGTIRYEAGVTFFPHREETDYGVSYDACASKELLRTNGRRSKKRDAQYLAELRGAVDALSAGLGGTVYWDKPLREAQYG